MILILKMNRTYKILLCHCHLAAFSDFFHGLFSCESRNIDYDCETCGSHIMLANFSQLHEAATEEIVKTSFTLRRYCKNLCSW